MRSILLVDDDAELLAALSGGLRRTHRVCVASSVDAAAEALRGGASFDAILCDLCMPDRPGTEILDELRLTAPELIARLAFMSGSELDSELVRTAAATGRPVLIKPFGIESLVQVVDRLVPCEVG